MQPRHMTSAVTTRSGGFTLLELLVVVGIVVVLIGLLLVGLNMAAQTAQKANTRFFMGGIANALVRFKEDTGYYPPILGPRGNTLAAPIYAGGGGSPANLPGFCRDLLPSPDGTMTAVEQQKWNSFTSLSEYLVGPDSRAIDGYGVNTQASLTGPSGPLPGAREMPATGIRHPGNDGVWGALLAPAPTAMAGYPASALGSFARRSLPTDNADNPAAGAAIVNMPRYQNVRGKALGPYLELKEARLMRGVTGIDANGEPILVGSDEVPNFEALPKVLVDYWGSPIRYYRRPYAAGMPSQPVEPPPFDLGEFFALRPASFSKSDDVDGTRADANGDVSTSRGLRAGDFALLSYGPDRAWNRTARRDAAERNADNIVEIGP